MGWNMLRARGIVQDSVLLEFQMILLSKISVNDFTLHFYEPKNGQGRTDPAGDLGDGPIGIGITILLPNSCTIVVYSPNQTVSQGNPPALRCEFYRVRR